MLGWGQFLLQGDNTQYKDRIRKWQWQSSVEQYLREGAAQHAAWRPCTTLKRGVRECEETGATQLIPSNRARTGEPQPTTSLLHPILATNNLHVPMYLRFV